MREITSRANPVIKHIARLGREPSYRREHGLMLCEGETMLKEALNAGITPRHVVSASEPDMPLPYGAEVIIAPKDVIKSVTTLDNPPRLLFTAPMPRPRFQKLTPGAYIIMDRIQDPGNVGSIIRTARALGISGVIMTTGCADVANPKALRAAMGAVFSQRLIFGEPRGILASLGGCKCYAAEVRPGAAPLSEVTLKNCAVVIGNEGTGISDAWRNIDTVEIPIEFESLGVASAAAIIMWEMSKCMDSGAS